MKVLLIIYGGDTMDDGSCGRNTTLRCEKALKWILQKQDKEIIIILAAGKRPDRPGFLSLKEKMKEYLHGISPRSLDIKIAKTDAWTTLYETAAAEEMMGSTSTHTIVVCSSNDHIPRIWITWLLFFGKKVAAISVVSTRPWYWCVAYESTAIIKYFFLFLLWRLKGQETLLRTI